MKKYIIHFSFLFILIGLQVSAQELNLQFMRGTLQANQIHPGMIPKGTFLLGLPAVYNDLYITDVTYGDVIIDRPTGERVFSLSNLINQLDDENFAREQPQVNSIAAGFKINNFYISLGHSVKGNAFLKYPKELAQIIGQGNAQFIGETIDIGPDFQASTYHETYLGLAYQLNKQISVGGRVKLLNGVFDLSSTRTSLQVFTDPEIYQLTMAADYVFNSSSWLQYDGFDVFEFSDLGDAFSDNFLSANSGIGLDLGLYINIDRFDLAISILDIGEINWDTEVFNYEAKGDYNFSGLDLTEALFDNDLEVVVGDTLRNIYTATETRQSYSTPLGTKVYISGTYRINPIFTAGAVGYLERFRDEFFPALGLNIQGRIGVLDAGLLYAFRNRRVDNLGLNIGLNLGPVQLYGATDNLLSAIDIENANSANIRLGLNLVFGKNKVKKLDKDPDNISNQDEFFGQ